MLSLFYVIEIFTIKNTIKNILKSVIFFRFGCVY